VEIASLILVELDHARIKLPADISFIQAVELIKNAVTHCRQHNHTRLLIDSTAMQIEIPTTAERFVFVTEVAKVSQAYVRIVVVARSEIIDPNRFGNTVAANRNLSANIFATEVEALAWLLSDLTG
jgi:hypothetical protein